MRILYSITFILSSIFCFSQNIELKYAVYGLGSNHNNPTYDRIHLENQNLTYHFTVKTNSIKSISNYDTVYWRKDTSIIVKIDKIDLDTITSLFKPLANTQITYSNLCVKSGACYKMWAKLDTACTSIVMYNNYDSTVFHVVNIINRYIPEELQLNIPFDLWRIARECMSPNFNLTAGRKKRYNCLNSDNE